MSTVQFTFDGVTYHGNKGEPLSAALLRNGIKVVTESSYRFRPRGVDRTWLRGTLCFSPD